jgi:hypothetical protein
MDSELPGIADDLWMISVELAALQPHWIERLLARSPADVRRSSSPRPSTLQGPIHGQGNGEVNPLRTAPLLRTWDYSCSEKSAPERVSGPC